MKKKYFPQILAAIILFLIFGVGMYLKYSNSSEQKETSSGAAQAELYRQETDEFQKKADDYAAYNTAVASADPGACEKISGNDALKSECLDNAYSAQASEKKDESICEKIIDKERKAHCHNAFAYNVAVASGKKSGCDTIVGDESLKASCLRNVVFTEIENPSFSGSAAEACSTLSGADKEYCTWRISKDSDIDLLQSGTSTKNLEVCSKIKDESMKNNCSDTVRMTLAVEQKDSALCQKISDSDKKAACLTQLARFSDASLLQEAISSGDNKKCLAIVTPEMKTKCSDTLAIRQAISNQNIALCQSISDASIKKQCIDSLNLILTQKAK